MKTLPFKSVAAFSVALMVLVGRVDAGTNGPSWWISRSVLLTNAPANDYAPVNQGQLKWVATQAAVELDANLPGGAGPAVSNLVASFTTSNNFRLVNLGQLKSVAKPFYDQLIAAGYVTNYPWNGSANPPNDYAMANLGQLKSVFSFAVADSGDSDGDGMPDGWEAQYGLLPLDPTDAWQDADGDGRTNLEEYRMGSNPRVADASWPGGSVTTIRYHYDNDGRLKGTFYGSAGGVVSENQTTDNLQVDEALSH